MKYLLFFLLTATCCLRAVEHWESSFAPPTGLDGDAVVLTTVGRNLYVGGNFERAGEAPAHGIARWDGTCWHSLGGGMDGEVRAIEKFGTNLLVGGRFSRAGDVRASNLALWDEANWHAIGNVDGWDPNWPDAPQVSSILVWQRDVYVAGVFRHASGVPATNVARWDGTNWHSVGAGVGSQGGRIFSLATHGARLFAAGMFINAGETAVTNIAQWEGKTWSPVGGGVRGGQEYFTDGKVVSGIVESLAVWRGLLFAGGSFTHAGELDVRNLAEWPGRQWANRHLPPCTSSGTAGLSVSTEAMFFNHQRRTGKQLAGGGAMERPDVDRAWSRRPEQLPICARRFQGRALRPRRFRILRRRRDHESRPLERNGMAACSACF